MSEQYSMAKIQCLPTPLPTADDRCCHPNEEQSWKGTGCSQAHTDHISSWETRNPVRTITHWSIKAPVQSRRRRGWLNKRQTMPLQQIMHPKYPRAWIWGAMIAAHKKRTLLAPLSMHPWKRLSHLRVPTRRDIASTTQGSSKGSLSLSTVDLSRYLLPWLGWSDPQDFDKIRRSSLRDLFARLRVFGTARLSSAI